MVKNNEPAQRPERSADRPERSAEPIQRIESLLEDHIKDTTVGWGKNERRLEAMAKELDENTAVTTGIREVVGAGRVAANVVRWVGYLAAAAAAIWALVYKLFSKPRACRPAVASV